MLGVGRCEFVLLGRLASSEAGCDATANRHRRPASNPYRNRV